MPCTESTICDRTVDESSKIQENISFITGDPGSVFAHMGWVGFAKLTIPTLTTGTILRCTSADINMSQEITMPSVVDGRIDNTVYQLGPKIVEGSLSLPVIADIDPTSFEGCVDATDLQSGTFSTLLDHIWCWVTARSSHGRLIYSDASLDVRYANHAAFRFNKCIANTLACSVAAEENINFDIGVIGESRTAGTGNTQGLVPMTDSVLTDPLISPFLSPARILTWNDATVTGVGGCPADEKLFGSASVMDFSFEINNNAQRFYSLNGRLSPVDINVSKREITGSLKLLGLADKLRLRAEDQQSFFTRKDEIRFQIFISNEAIGSRDWWTGDTPTGISGNLYPIFYKKFTSVIYQIPTMSLSNDVFTTEVEWRALANDQENFEALSPSASSCDFPAWQ